VRERQHNIPLEALYLMGMPQAENSDVSGAGGIQVKETPSGNSSPALRTMLSICVGAGGNGVGVYVCYDDEESRTDGSLNNRTDKKGQTKLLKQKMTRTIPSEDNWVLVHISRGFARRQTEGSRLLAGDLVEPRPYQDSGEWAGGDRAVGV